MREKEKVTKRNRVSKRKREREGECVFIGVANKESKGSERTVSGESSSA